MVSLGVETLHLPTPLLSHGTWQSWEVTIPNVGGMGATQPQRPCSHSYEVKKTTHLLCDIWAEERPLTSLLAYFGTAGFRDAVTLFPVHMHNASKAGIR